MSYNIWFVPSNSSHMSKNAFLLKKLRDKGCQIHLLCLDEVLPDISATRKYVEQSGYPFELLPGGSFRRNSHWIIRGLQQKALIRNMREVLSKQQIDVLLFGGDSDIAPRTLIAVARSLCIPTVVIPDGLIVPANPRFRKSILQRSKEMLGSYVRGFVPAPGPQGTSGVDLILLMNEMGREELIKRKVDSCKIRVVGSPEYDALARLAQEEPVGTEGKQQLYKKTGTSKDRPIVFFAHQKLGLNKSQERQLIRDMVNGTQQCGATLLVKFHPRSRAMVDKWREWRRHENLGDDDVVFIKNECTSTEAISLCSSCVTAYSTVALEALIWGKPLVLIQYLNIPWELPYGRKYGAAIEADSPEALKSAIISVITDPNTREGLRKKAVTALEKELLGPDGKSLDRMAESLFSVMQHSAVT